MCAVRKHKEPLPPRLIATRIEAGCDEAGRGCIAGPVVAAAVILPAEIVLPSLDDSKKLTARQREELRIQIEEHSLAYAVASVSPAEIDRINILRASIHAMNLAVSQLSITPEHLLIDGNRFVSECGIDYTTIVKGDGKYASIAAASILAKTYRDAEMCRLAELYPEYGWEQNAGYPTPAHLEALRRYGTTEHHRMSFAPCQPSLFDVL